MINRKKLSQIKCIVVQVDGVLTDGKFWLNHEGHKQRKFSVRDSMTIRRLLKAGYGFAVILNSPPAPDEQQIFEHFEQIGVKNFLRILDGYIDFSELFSALEISEHECAHLVSAPTPSSHDRTSVEFVTGSEGGEGAVAQFGQLILDHGFYSSTSQTTPRKAANS